MGVKSTLDSCMQCGRGKGNHMFEIIEIIDLALQIEKNGEKIYRNALKRVTNPAVYTLLQKLADEELNHVEWFSSLK